MTDVVEKRPQSRGEEIANAISHGAGAVLAAIGAGPLLYRAVKSGSVTAMVGMTLYAASLMVLYINSTVYHASTDPARKRVLRIMDHCSIFLLILGTYIPVALLTLGGKLGWILVVINAVLAGVGITLKVIDLRRFSKVSLLLYALMGWLVIPAFKTVLTMMPFAGVMLLLSGGVAYTAGIIFYKSKKRYMHFVWHLFVLAGSILQYFCVLFYCV